MGTSSEVDLSVVITAHREGIIAGATSRSAIAAIDRAAAEASLSCEVIVILDNSDALTRRTLHHGLKGCAPRFIETNIGDPGGARNQGVRESLGSTVAFLDADDLWSSNWLIEATKLLRERPDCIAHSTCNVQFGLERNIWWHIDSEGPFFNPDYLEWGNYWDALSMARRDLYLQFPFLPNDLKFGYGHEDWHWNAVTIAAGIPHKPVPETVHFKRRRAGSQMALVERSGSVRRPL